MGPLDGLRVLEFAGVGPGPFAAMMLADMGAEVLRIDRPNPSGLGIIVDERHQLHYRGRRSVAIDLKDHSGVELALRLAGSADVLIEGFRPGVMEKLGLGPEVCLRRNGKLVYGRMTGWGQSGPLAGAAGHDINYIALAGVLHTIGQSAEPPVPPLNLVGDFGGGALYLAFGVLCALHEAAKSGRGQVVDAAMVEGAASLMTMIFGLAATGSWQDRRQTNILDGAAPYYGAYETSDGQYVSVGAIEPKFYAQLLDRLELTGDPDMQEQNNRNRWPEMKRKMAAKFKTKTRDQWCRIMEGSDACFAPVLSLNEVSRHPHMTAREAFVAVDGLVQPAPAPRFSRSKPKIQGPPPRAGQHTGEALRDWGIEAEEIAQLMAGGVIVSSADG